MFTVYFDGEAEALINELGEKAVAGELNRDEKDLYRKIRKALQHLETNPRHPGLKSHEIDVLTEKYGVRIWESYLENRKAGARRMFWIYGPETKEITIIGIENHPEPGRGFARVRLATKAIKKATENQKKPKK
ncbi:hypothetical protein QEH52_12050 [Coraliomargarita sp. SDUM461003]|uniref:Uncharacterized protein n=1 Tax=Thalassobacterium maritimum TaxID=3041265 RepID=A0ABU1AVS1_9BACT|nr:hypothetical protein [Coraliomargarita sp. SDUM461003]MDQ8208246.1 hypothetical protein [Coraliomargarita sp. SDUM461003]